MDDMNDSFISSSCAKEITHILAPFISSDRPHPHVTHIIRLTVTPGRSCPQTELYARSFISSGRALLQVVHILVTSFTSGRSYPRADLQPGSAFTPGSSYLPIVHILNSWQASARQRSCWPQGRRPYPKDRSSQRLPCAQVR